MSRLVIAEKPSVARELASVLGADTKKNGYFVGGGYMVSWCVGHLVGMVEASFYDEKYKSWRKADLPIIPEEFKYTVLKEGAKQAEILKSLLGRNDVCEVVNACDAGREGELIFRLVYNYYGCKKPVKRLWLSCVERGAILEALAAMKPGEAYDNLYKASLCRARADWLVGINATRLFSVLYGETLNVGRVVAPSLAMLAERQEAIQNFKEEALYQVALEGNGILAKHSSGKLRDRIQARNVLEDCMGKQSIVRSLTKGEVYEAPPKLFCLTSLQKEANKRFGLTATKTMAIAQTLYEKKLLTYPRTDSRYLNTHMKHSLQALLNQKHISGLTSGKTLDIGSFLGQVLDDSKVSDHHAIIPTSQPPEGLSPEEQRIWNMVATRLLSATSPRCEYMETVLELEVMAGEAGSHVFVYKGRQISFEGWKGVELSGDKSEEDEAKVPDKSEFVLGLKHGDELLLDCKILEGKTKPPELYTEATLLSAMERAGAAENSETSRKGLGTPATRAGIIDKLIRTGLAQRKGRSILATENGRKLISLLPKDLTSPRLTANWENSLYEVETGKISESTFMKDIESFVRTLISENSEANKEVSFQKANTSQEAKARPKQIIGSCPKCGGNVVDTNNAKLKAFVCSNKCGFLFWKEDYLLKSQGKSLDREMASSLLKDKKVFVKGLRSAKTGKEYDAWIVLRQESDKIRLCLEFSDNSTGKSR